MKKSNFFNIIDCPKNEEDQALGVLVINDLSKKSEFMFQDWGLPIFRPISLDIVKDLNDCVSETKTNGMTKNFALDDLVDLALEKMNKWQKKGQETYFVVVSFDENLTENFCLRYSRKANLPLLGPIEKNLSVSGQKFKFIDGCSNRLFDKIESSISGISCFDLCFGKSIEKASGNVYSKERVFEEVLIFASLSFSGKI